MKMSKVFGYEDDVDDNQTFKTNNEYAKAYDNWRKKEELNKLKTKYGEDVLEEEESSSSSDDEEGVEITEDVEKDFFRTLACLKNKDPRIYKKDVNFFSNPQVNTKIKKKDKEKPIFLKDYERNLIIEKGGVLSDEDDIEKSRSPTYMDEQKHIKESFKSALEDSEDENDNWGGVLKQRQKTRAEITEEESDYKQWLVGMKNKPEDENIVKDLKPLKDYWNKPDLDQGEKFLRDYILKKKYLDNNDDEYIPTYDEIIHDSDKDLSNDEENIEKQEEFEHKYNFRYEEPDQEFIKTYPRTMENSLRKTDDRRKLKRQEIKERKKKEKEEKMREVKKMKQLKLKEIEEKLEKLKEITGNSSLGFVEEDVDGDFDPETHDKKMQALFNDEFYAVPEDEQKPEFPDLDEELEIENWERYAVNTANNDLNCEDEAFNMDCDYDPQASKDHDDVEHSGSRKKRKRKSKFATAVSKQKPKFDPKDKKFEKYFDEYYKLDCEDIIGDIPCRFKYRQVVPNDFGLTTEEILLANERELNKWCSLKKAVQIRSDEVEKYEQIAYSKKGQNVNLKMKILPSLFSTDVAGNNEEQSTTTPTDAVEINNTKEEIKHNGKVETPKKKKQRKSDVSQESNITQNKEDVEAANISINKNQKITIDDNKDTNTISKIKKKKNTKNRNNLATVNHSENAEHILNNKKRKSRENSELQKKTKKRKFSKNQDVSTSMSDARLSAYGINPKKFKNKLKYKK